MKLDSLSLTCKLLSFNTVNPPGDERECACCLGEFLEKAGFSARYYEFAADHSRSLRTQDDA